MCDGDGHLVKICADVVTVLACQVPKGCQDDSNATISGEEKEAFMCDTPSEHKDESNDQGVVLRLLGRWGISALSAIVGHRAICLTHQPESLTTMSRMPTCGRRAV